MKEDFTEDDSKREKRRKKVKKTYDALAEELSLTGDVISDVHTLIEKGQEVQCEICKMLDSIRITDYEEANKLSPIDQGTYMAFVTVAAQKMNGKLTEKAFERFENDFNNRLFITNARHTFLNTYMSDEDLKIADDADTAFEPFEEHKSDEFQKILENSAMTRTYINTTLYGRLKALGEAAEYITYGELDYKKFKMINDFEYHINGGYPKPSTPAKLWSIYNKFNDAHRLMTKYEFTQQDNLCDEFGLDVTLNEPKPVTHPWMLAEDNID